MKKTIIFLLSILLFSEVFSQQDDSTYYIWNKVQYGNRQNRGWFDKMLYFPYRDSAEKGDRPGAFIKFIGDNQVYQWENGKWNAFGGIDNSKVPLTRSITINGITQDLIANRTWTLGKSDIGLANVDNTSDLNKPVSIAQQAALNLKVDSVKRRTDSVFFYKNGVEVFAYKDSVGGGATNINANYAIRKSIDTVQLNKNLLLYGGDDKIDFIQRFVSDSGNNSNSGLSDAQAKLNLANIQNDVNLLANYYGDARAGLKARSLFREQFTISQHGVKVGSYDILGGKAYARITGMEPAGTWTDTSNMGKQSWAHSVPTNQAGYHYIFVTEIDTLLGKSNPYDSRRPMRLAASLTECDTTPGTYYTPALNVNPIMVYVHPTAGNANSNAYRYEIVKRPFVIDATAGGTVANGAFKKAVIEHLNIIGSGHGYGMIGAGDSILIRNNIIGEGGTHHVVANSGIIDNNVFRPGPRGLAQGETAIVMYEAQGGGNFSRITNNIILNNASPILSHIGNVTTSTWTEELNISGNYLFADTAGSYGSTALSGDGIKRLAIRNNYIYGYKKAFSGLATEFVVEGNIFNRISERSGLSYPTNYPINFFYNNNLLVMEGDATGAGMYGLQLTQTDFKGTITNSIFRDQSNKTTSSTFLVGVQSSVDQIQSYRNIFIVDRTNSGASRIIVGDKLSSGTPFVNNYKGDYNVYIKVKGTGPQWILLNNGGSPTLTTLAAWQAQSGQDQHSIYFDCANYPAGLKQIFIDPDNGNYNLANTPQGDSIRALRAGMTTPPAFFPRFPTQLEAVESMRNPGSIASAWKYGVGKSGSIIYDGSETKITQGTNVTVTGSGTVASPYVINASGGGGGASGLDSTVATTLFHNVDGNTYSGTPKFGAKNSKTISFLTNNTNRGFLRSNGDWLFGPDSTGITAGDATVTVKGNLTQTGSVAGTTAGVTVSPTLTATANSQSLSPLYISPTFSIGAFTSIAYRFFTAQANVASNFVTGLINNSGSGGGASFVASSSTSSIQLRSDGLVYAPSTDLQLTPAGTSNGIRFNNSFGVAGAIFQNGLLKIGDGTAGTARLTLGANLTGNNRGVGGVQSAFLAATYTDNNTSASGTVAHVAANGIAQPTLAASNTSVTYTNASTLYLDNAPAAGTNVTITNPWSLFVNNGRTRVGALYLNGTMSSTAPVSILGKGTDSSVVQIMAPISNTGTLDFDLTSVNSQDLTITVTGATVGDVVAIGVPNGSVATDVTFFAWVSATNTVSVRASRVGGGAAVDPASGTFKVTVFKF
ncbi:MAG: hypothetical protein ACTHMC_01440 [Pseudobacter sp.]|uniref:hypothetical protein n=1 Tax=Pseudobacter sp. TaxID=2045420 RepID=UPI003F819DED